MKVRIFDFMRENTCSVERAAVRVMHMRMDDAFALAFILRKLVYSSYYNPESLELSTDGAFVVPQVVYEDIATLSKVMMKKPCNRSEKGMVMIADKIYDLMSEENENNDNRSKYKIPMEDIPELIHELKRDFDEVTSILNGLPVGLPEDTNNYVEQNRRQELWNWVDRARTLHYNVGIDIENIERVINERILTNGESKEGGEE